MASTIIPAIKDSYGRTLILHGLNTSNSAKYDPLRQPWISEADVEREDKEFGFNFVRYLITWDALEPEEGTYNTTYLDMVEERVEWYTSRGMYVMLDMHQDLWGPAVGGNGAPSWATITDSLPSIIDPSGLPWWFRNFDPPVWAAFQNFWKYSNYAYLQDHYIQCWILVAERFRDNPYVIGYDLMNEPTGGDPLKTITAVFEKNQLTPFYNRLITAIRETDLQKYIFIEPRIVHSVGVNSFLPKILDTRPDEQRLVYAPHIYPVGIHEGQPYSNADKEMVAAWEENRKREVSFQEMPMLIGEMGVSPTTIGFNNYLNDLLDIADKFKAGWAYYSSDPGGWGPLNYDKTESPILPILLRPYPRATAGNLLYYNYEPNSRVYSMEILPDKNITAPTEIFIPIRHYPTGWKIFVTPASEWSYNWLPEKQILQLYIKGNINSPVSIKVLPD